MELGKHCKKPHYLQNFNSNLEGFEEYTPLTTREVIEVWKKLPDEYSILNRGIELRNFYQECSYVIVRIMEIVYTEDFGEQEIRDGTRDSEKRRRNTR